MNYTCPKCNTEQEIECDWDSGKCISCGIEYWWDEMVIYDEHGEPTDDYPYLQWEY